MKFVRGRLNIPVGGGTKRGKTSRRIRAAGKGERGSGLGARILIIRRLIREATGRMGARGGHNNNQGGRTPINLREKNKPSLLAERGARFTYGRVAMRAPDKRKHRAHKRFSSPGSQEEYVIRDGGKEET